MHDLRFCHDFDFSALGYSAVSRMASQGGNRGGHGCRDGRAASSSQPEDSVDSGLPQRQDPGVTRAEFLQMMGMMAQIVQALVPPVRAVPVAAAPPHPEESEQHSRAEARVEGEQQTEQSVPARAASTTSSAGHAAAVAGGSD